MSEKSKLVEVDKVVPFRNRLVTALVSLAVLAVIYIFGYFADHTIRGLIFLGVFGLPALVLIVYLLIEKTVIQILGVLLGIDAAIIASSAVNGWLSFVVFFVVMGGFIYLYQKLIQDTELVKVKEKKLSTHGTAEWAESIGAHTGGKSDKFVLGKFIDEETNQIERFYQTGHMLTCAPSGAGKGIGVVIPNLLEYGGSVFCVDIKGENYAVTADHRREMGQKVVVVDPFGVTGSDDPFGVSTVDSFNLIDWLKAFPSDLTSDSQMIADALVVSTGSGDADFWNDSAKDLLRGLIAYVSTLEGSRSSMGEVRRILTLSKDDFNAVMIEMQSSPVAVVERCANNVLSMDEKTRSGILTTAQQQTAFLDEDRITRALSYSSFDLSKFKNGSMSFYLIMPPERLSANFRLIRLFISLLITSVTRIKEKPEIPALFLFDEFAQLGRMTLLEDSLSLIRGYGASYWFIIQDLSQLKAVYTKWQTFLANTTKQFFATADYDTAKYISDTLGQKTIEYFTQSSGSSTSSTPGQNGQQGSQSFSSSANTSQQYAGRNLLNPDEVMRLNPDDVLVFSRSESAYKLQRLNYLKDAEYAGQFCDNPMH